MPPKTHHTSVAAIPPEEVWEPIQVIRRQHDRQLARWMPHVNLLYPFWARDQFEVVLPGLTQACRQIASFPVTLATFRSFTHRGGRGTIWLDPEPQEAFVALQGALQEAFPEFDEQSRFAHGFTPHLSVGQVATRQAMRGLLTSLQADWTPVTFRLTEVALIAREADSPFRIEHRIPLAHETG